jgi:hypothetical protein
MLPALAVSGLGKRFRDRTGDRPGQRPRPT